MDWLDLAENRYRLPALVIEVRTFDFHKMRGILD
jgi:hypothetical protein